MKILGTGLTGLVGSRITKLLSDKYRFQNISRSTGVDITNAEQMMEVVKSTDASVILHLAAKANVDACEEDKERGESGEAWQVNVEGTKNIVTACKKVNKKIVFISTDFVFSGENTPANGYAEDDATGPVNWYATTKDEAEKVIKQSGVSYLILRIAFPYTYVQGQKHFIAAITNRLKNKQPIAVVHDEIFTPTWLDDLAEGIDLLLRQNATGIYHIGGGSALSPFAIAHQIAETFGYDRRLISQTDRDRYFAGKAKRPFNTSLNNAKIMQLGLHLTTCQQGIKKIAIL